MSKLLRVLFLVIVLIVVGASPLFAQNQAAPPQTNPNTNQAPVAQNGNTGGAVVNPLSQVTTPDIRWVIPILAILVILALWLAARDSGDDTYVVHDQPLAGYKGGKITRIRRDKDGEYIEEEIEE